VALVLTLRKKEAFYANDAKVMVRDILSADHCIVETSEGKTFDVTEDKSVEIMPEVFVSIGVRGQLDMARIAIEAPRSILILREDKYLAGKNAVPRV
jgi:hypothetical protein